MHIGIDASRANKAVKTGVEWYSYHLIQQFKQIDHADRFSLYTREALTGGLERLPDNFSERVLGWPPRYLWTQARLSWEMLRRAPDALFVPAHAMPAVSQKNTVVTIHDIGFDRFPELYKPVQIWYHRFATKRAVQRARAIITVSEFSKKELIDIYGADPSRVFVTHLGYDSDTYTATGDTAQVREKYGIGERYLIFVGRLEEKKNIRRIIAAFRRARAQDPELELVLVGAPGHGYAGTAAAIRGDASIHELSWLPADEVAALYRGALALVFPSLYEGFGLPIIEAQACGCPVITSNRCSMPEVGGSGAYYVDPEDEGDLAGAIMHMATDASLRERLAREGFENARRFSWERCARETLAIITGAPSGQL